jgi:hypothetical protein
LKGKGNPLVFSINGGFSVFQVPDKFFHLCAILLEEAIRNEVQDAPALENVLAHLLDEALPQVEEHDQQESQE